MECKLVMKGRYTDTSIVENVYTFTTNATSSGDAVLDVTDWVSVMIPWLTIPTSNQLEYFAGDIYVWDPGDDDWFLAATFAIDEGVGLTGGSYNANQDAALLVARTGDGTQPGKKFIAGMNDAFAVNGRWTEDGMDDLQNILEIYITPFITLVANELVPVVISKVGHVIHPIVGGTVDAIISSQRRRKPNIGI